MDREYVLASGNQGKLREIAAMLKPLGFIVRPQSDWQVPEADETACTFIENALIKARQAAAYTGLPSIADDSGLVVPALHGEPGIYSSRYAGHDADDAANIDKLLSELSGSKVLNETPISYVPWYWCKQRMIRHRCWRSVAGMDISSCRSRVRAALVMIHCLVLLPRRVMAAIFCSPDDSGGKESVSHRGQALRDLVRQLRERDEGFTA